MIIIITILTTIITAKNHKISYKNTTKANGKKQKQKQKQKQTALTMQKLEFVSLEYFACKQPI